MSELLKLTELAEVLGITHRAVQSRRKNGTLGIPVFDITTSSRPAPRVKRVDVEAYLKTRQVS